MNNFTAPSPGAVELTENLAFKFWAASGFTLLIVASIASWLTSNEPPGLWDTIPFVSNTLQFLTNNELFMKRVM
jgi:hypothetical protein